VQSSSDDVHMEEALTLSEAVDSVWSHGPVVCHGLTKWASFWRANLLPPQELPNFFTSQLWASLSTHSLVQSADFHPSMSPYHFFKPLDMFGDGQLQNDVGSAACKPLRRAEKRPETHGKTENLL
jgi:hypothetical protein